MSNPDVTVAAVRSGSSAISGSVPRSGVPDRPAPGRLRLHPVGLVVATAFAMMAMTPSLVPRNWVFQGVVCGVSAAAGYGVGVAITWLVRRSPRWRRVSDWVRRRLPRRLSAYAWAVPLLGVPVALGGMLVIGARWQRELAVLMGMEQTTTTGWLRAGPLLMAVAAVLLAAARAIRLLARLVARLLHRWVRLPRRLASVGGAVVVGLIVITVLNDIVLSRALSVADAAFSATNRGTVPGVLQPRQPTRSGSPGSMVPWDTLGLEGRRFVAGGRSPKELSAAGTRTARDPIRAYVGLDSAPGPQERANLAVAELERAGAFDRSVLAVVTTTGTGWVNPAAPESLELMYGGDTAIVATQYSYLPSWLSFLVDRSRVEQAGRLLFDAVHARWRQLPDWKRPRLLAYGESLGSQGSEAAFSSLADLRARADGVLWVGPPSSNRVWDSLVTRRDSGSTQIEPVYASGLVVRFAGDATDLVRPPTPWLEPRVLYLQHPSDPIVWWSPGLLLRRPDWLIEPRGEDVLPAMSWYPIVTFWQVSADLLHAKEVPDGHGHNYGDLILDGWVAVAAPDGWTAGDTERVRRVLDA